MKAANWITLTDLADLLEVIREEANTLSKASAT